MVKDPQRIDCCETGRWAIAWRHTDPVRGPEKEGWAMIVHILVGTPEYANVLLCPFCGRAVNSDSQKQ